MTTVADLLAHPELGIRQCIGEQTREVRHAAALGNAVPFVLVFAGSKIEPAQLQALVPQLKDSVILCTPALAHATSLPDTSVLICDNPRLSFMRAVRNFFAPALPQPGIHPSAVIHPTAHIHPAAAIGAHCVVGANSCVGEGSILYPNVTLYEKVSIGRHVRIHSGTVIGADGYGYERNEHGELEKFPHIGGVEIGDHVEIGSNTSIDRGTLGNTKIMHGVKIDNHVHIAHNVVIAAQTAITAGVVIAGSVKMGECCWVAPGTIITNQISIGHHATLGLGAVVTKPVSDEQTVVGFPARPALRK